MMYLIFNVNSLSYFRFKFGDRTRYRFLVLKRVWRQKWRGKDYLTH